MKLIRTIHPEVKIIDAALGLVDYVASDETLDYYQEIINAVGWKFTNFAKNAPFVDSHDYSSISSLLGEVVSWQIQDGKLVERVRWANSIPEQPLAQLGWKMTEAGFLKAVSVGFFPVKAVSKWNPDQADFLAAITDLKLTPEQAASVRTIYLQQEQIELSACIIGANPNALAKAHTAGAITDADLAANGFEDDDMTFLHEAADSFRHVTNDVQRSICATLKALTRKSLSKSQPTTAPSATKRADAEEARRRDRDWFLGELKAHSTIHTK